MTRRTASKHQALRLRRLNFVIVIVCLVGLGLLLLSGLRQPTDEPMRTLHEAVGHLMLPATCLGTGIWLGMSVARLSQQPLGFLLRLLFLLLLNFCCWSNTRTGYFGPSYLDPVRDPATHLRFNVMHRVFFPGLIGLLLLVWGYRIWRGGLKKASAAMPSAPPPT